MQKLIFLLIIGFLAGSAIGICMKERPEGKVVENEIKKEEKYEQPKWIIYPAIKKSKSYSVLSDIRCHIDDGGYYNDSDLITAGHETTHGINSFIRNKYYDGTPINAFYCLEDRAIILNEPKTRIETVASKVPRSLRGSVYNLYLVEQASSWGDRSLYLLDEWVSYTNGSKVRKDLQIKSRAETVRYMLEFDIYVLTLLMVLDSNESSYNSENLSVFVRWNIERGMLIYNNEQEATEYLEKFKTASDAEPLRTFVKKKYGNDWVKKIFGI